jgi:hypothetical protein
VWGYVIFELIHYALHQVRADPSHVWPFCTVFWAEARRNHLAHHNIPPPTRRRSADQEKISHAFGVTSPLGDILGGTTHQSIS